MNPRHYAFPGESSEHRKQGVVEGDAKCAAWNVGFGKSTRLVKAQRGCFGGNRPIPFERRLALPSAYRHPQGEAQRGSGLADTATSFRGNGAPKSHSSYFRRCFERGEVKEDAQEAAI